METAYSEGYRSCGCFWGTDPASYVRRLAAEHPVDGRLVLDIGCGEGKNAAHLASLGAAVHAIDTSPEAIENGKRTWPTDQIRWVVADVLAQRYRSAMYDIVVAYGLLHCFDTEAQVEWLLSEVDRAVVPGGLIVACALNDRLQELENAHPNFKPLLLAHSRYVELFANRWEVLQAEDGTITEAHPHNKIEHRHSVTRILARSAVS
jgi:tellurite methyltransferase